MKVKDSNILKHILMKMTKSRLAMRYIRYLISAVIFVNILQFGLTFLSPQISIDTTRIIRQYLPNFIGLLFVIRMLLDKVKLPALDLFLFLGVIFLTILNYFYGVILFILIILCSSSLKDTLRSDAGAQSCEYDDWTTDRSSTR